MPEPEEYPEFPKVRLPPRPLGVKVHPPDGSDPVNCELAYKGTDEHGHHVWDVLTKVGPGYRVTVLKMPGQTLLNFPMREGAGDLDVKRTDPDHPENRPEYQPKPEEPADADADTDE